jgi:hypothetical protein
MMMIVNVTVLVSLLSIFPKSIFKIKFGDNSRANAAEALCFTDIPDFSNLVEID